MIETERLLLYPLTYGQLVKYLKNDNSLEDELHLICTKRSVSEELAEALEHSILLNVADPNQNYLFSTLWTAILKAENRMVGDVCFVGEPNERGEVEIGYGTYEAFRKQGYMTEAVGGMITWAKQQPKVNSIFAASEKHNIGSYNVLIKNNFVRVGETDTLYNWRLKF